ncbi:MAG: hypothetical protein KTR15_05965 [Phycisphaeraceae bacterium]|nr:hypothetical protein [Phycisphaeraceae bacterium]
MPSRLTSLTAGLALLIASGGIAQEYAGPVVDRNVGDTGPNSASQRYMQPGLGQFGVGSLLLDRYERSPHTFDRFNPIVGDSRTSHRYIMQAPGVSALMSRPDYIGPSPRGGWVFNQQTYDGAEILSYSADTVFVLTPELLRPMPKRNEADTAWLNNPNRVRPRTVGDPHAIMRDTIITGQPTRYTTDNHPAVQRDPNYVHPEIIDRRKRLKAEREADRKAEEAERQEEAEDKNSETTSEASKTESEESET